MRRRGLRVKRRNPQRLAGGPELARQYGMPAEELNRLVRRILTHSAACAALLPGFALAQLPSDGGQPIQTAPADPAVTAALGKIFPEQIRTDIAKLVSFKNRSTLSSLDTDLPA